MHNFASIYLAYIPIEKGLLDKAFRVHGDYTLPSPSAPCLFIGENTEEGLPRLLASSLSVTFYNPQGI